MARITIFHEPVGPEVLRAESIDPHEPGPGKIRVRMKAIALNRANALVISEEEGVIARVDTMLTCENSTFPPWSKAVVADDGGAVQQRDTPTPTAQP